MTNLLVDFIYGKTNANISGSKANIFDLRVCASLVLS